MKKIIQEKNYQKSKKIRLVFSLLMLMLICLVVFQVIASNQLIEKGGRIGELNEKIEIGMKKNQELQQKIAQETSLDKISQKAAELGMIKSTPIIYLSTPLEVAFNQ